MAHADPALAARPEDLNALVWAVSAKGNLAVQTGRREAVRLAQDVWSLGHRMLELDPDHAVAHYALGKAQYEVLKLGFVQRFLARRLLGGDLMEQASWPGALAHGRSTVELDPGSLLFRVGLADILWRLGQREEAVAELNTARELPRRMVIDSDFRAQAGRALRRIEAGRSP